MLTILPTLIAQFGTGVTAPTDTYNSADPLADLDLFISNILGLFTVFGALFFIVYFLIAAIQWISSGGDSGKLAEARNKMIQGVLGLIILVASYGIIGLIGTVVGIDILDPTAQFQKILP